MLKKALKKVSIIFLIITTAWAIYMGAYLPLQKSYAYIDAKRKAFKARSFAEFKSIYNKAFNYPSPVGQRELGKFFTSSLQSAVANKNQTARGAEALAKFGESKIFKDYPIHQLNMAYVYATMYKNFDKKEYFKKAEHYFKKMREIGPDLPHPLYGLLGLYLDTNKKQKAKEIALKILKRWPNSKKAKSALLKMGMSKKEIKAKIGTSTTITTSSKKKN
ncbi:MAG: hypothetical protein ABEI53_01190 [Candidatus Magasanikbacteria bacterium]